jgi:hypothetical protein
LPAGLFPLEIGASFAYKERTARGAISKREKPNGSQENHRKEQEFKEGQEARSSQAAQSSRVAQEGVIRLKGCCLQGGSPFFCAREDQRNARQWFMTTQGIEKQLNISPNTD